MSYKRYEEGEKYKKEIKNHLAQFLNVCEVELQALEEYRDVASFFFLHDSSSGVFKNTYKVEKMLRHLVELIKDALASD